MKICLKYGLFFVFLLIAAFASGQDGKKINIISADEARFDKQIGTNARRLIGNVGFKHEDAYMYCDSAWFYGETNSMDAFGNVVLEQGDSVTMTGKYMSYNGYTRLAKVRDSVVLVHKNSRLLTDSLNFDRTDNIGYFFEGGEIIHQDINMTSREGYYYPDSKDFNAVYDVEMVHPDYTIFADSLKYNTESEITTFVGPTHIVSDSSRIVCSSGYHDSQKEISAFGKNTTIYQQSQTIKADSIFYDQKTGDGRAWKNVDMLDTAENFAGTGNYAEYNDKKNESMMTDSALVMYFEDTDTTYIHGDTVFLYNDSLNKRIIQAYYHVQIFASDFQGRCDSLLYLEGDSLARMFHDPVLWAEESQITADTIELFLKDNKADRINMLANALIVIEEDSVRFSQISGNNMFAKLKNNELSRIFVPENAETIYYIRDDKTEDIIGVNKETSREMTIFREDGQIQQIKFVDKPDGALLPDDQTNPSELRLNQFQWLSDLRPRRIRDLFVW
ncbi:MAG: OstA-like protein [Bacteroidota bacterium]